MSSELRNRYGNYPFFNPINVVTIAGFLWGAGMFVYTPKERCFGLLLMVVGTVTFISLYHPFSEKFYISNNVVHHKKGRYTEEISIPNYANFVLSYATVGFLHFGKFMVNIVTEDVDTTLKILHKNDDYNKSEMLWRSLRMRNIAGYDNTMIKGFLKHRCIYSFLYDKQFADELFSSQKKKVIIPRSIYDKIEIAPDAYTIIIDEKA